MTMLDFAADEQALTQPTADVDPIDRLNTDVAIWLESDEVVTDLAVLEEELAEAAALTQIDLQTQYQDALAIAKRVKVARKAVEERWATVQPHVHKVWKLLSSSLKVATDPADAAERRLKRLATTFQDEQEQKRRAEERRLQEEIAAQERAQREAAAKVAEESGRKAEAEVIRETPSPAPPVVVPRAAYVPPVTGASRRSVWKGEITDLVAYVAAIAAGQVPIVGALGISEEKDRAGVYRCKFVNEQARSLKSTLSIPGVRSYNEATLNLR